VRVTRPYVHPVALRTHINFKPAGLLKENVGTGRVEDLITRGKMRMDKTEWRK
jgi:hypothetical protein